MWYITFHGVSSDYNIYAYDDEGNRLTKTVLDKSFDSDAMLRGMGFGPDGKFYVLDGSKDNSQVLVFSGDYDDKYERQYESVFTSKDIVPGMVHPFDFCFEPNSGDYYISSQDTNVVTKVYGPTSVGDRKPGTAAGLASSLAAIPDSKFLDGTYVASAYTNLPEYPEDDITPVAQPKGLDASPNDGSKVSNSVRGVVYADGKLYVVDEPGNAVKVYDAVTGDLLSSITGDTLIGPVHLLLVSYWLYIGCAGDGKNGTVKPSVLLYNILGGNGDLATVVSDPQLKSVAGFSFGGDGKFYVADRKANVIYRYDTSAVPYHSPEVFIDSNDNQKQGLPDDPEFLLHLE